MLKHNNAYKTIGEVVKILDLKSRALQEIINYKNKQ